MDSFRAQPGGLVPHCQLRVSGTEVGSMLEECVSLKGAKKPYNFFMMICGPTIAGVGERARIIVEGLGGGGGGGEVV